MLSSSINPDWKKIDVRRWTGHGRSNRRLAHFLNWSLPFLGAPSAFAIKIETQMMEMENVTRFFIFLTMILTKGTALLPQIRSDLI